MCEGQLHSQTHATVSALYHVTYAKSLLQFAYPYFSKKEGRDERKRVPEHLSPSEEGADLEGSISPGLALPVAVVAAVTAARCVLVQEGLMPTQSG